MLRALAMAGVLLAVLGSACTPVFIPEDRTDRRERVLTVESHVGGTHHRTIVTGGQWYQTFSNELLIIDPSNGRTNGMVEVVPFGEGGPIVDIAVDGKTVWAVSDFWSVVEIDVSVPTRPTVVSSISAKELGLEPRCVSLAGGDVWVTGEGGAVRLRDRKRFLTGEPVGRVVQTAAGPATTVGRRILMVETGRYLGAATELQPLPTGFGPDGGYLFVLQGQKSAQVGLMSPHFTETASVAIEGVVRRARAVGDKLCLVRDTGLEFWTLEDGKLTTPRLVSLKGARDIDQVVPNTYAVAGSFGRANYRLLDDRMGPADTFFNVQREPGLLEMAMTDRSRVLAGGREGFWLWKVGGAAELTERPLSLTEIPQRQADAAWGSAEIVINKDNPLDSQRVVRIKHDGTSMDYVPDGSPRISSVELVDGDLWIGHERGLDILRRRGPGQKEGPPAAPQSMEGATFTPLHQFRFEGPVLFVFPQGVGGGASLVSLHGGFALLRTMRIGPEPVFSGEGTIK